MKFNFVKYLFGWKEPTKIPNEPCVLVMAHTCYWDVVVQFLLSSTHANAKLHFRTTS